MTCERCSTENLDIALYCSRCGDGLRGRKTRGGYAVQAGESVRQMAVISTIMPHSNHRTGDHYRWAILVGGVLVLAAAALGLIPLALAAAAFLIPLAYIVYMYNINLWQDAPAKVMLLLYVGTGLLAALVSLAFYHWVFGGQFAEMTLHAATGEVGDVPLVPLLIFAVVLPIITEIVKNLGPVVLARMPQFDDMIDGLTFGVAAGASYAAFETIIAFSSVFTSGDFRVENGIATWIVVILNLMVVKTLIYGTATGLAMAAFSGKGIGYDGFTPAYFKNFGIAVGAGIVYWVGVQLLAYAPYGNLLGLILGLVILAFLIVRIRVVMQAALLEAALEDASSRLSDVDAECPECENPVLAGAAFCVACGTNVRATAPAVRTTMHADQSTDDQRVQRAEGSAVSVVAMVAVGAVAAAAIAAAGVALAGSPANLDDLPGDELGVELAPAGGGESALVLDPTPEEPPEEAPQDTTNGDQVSQNLAVPISDTVLVLKPAGWDVKALEPGYAYMVDTQGDNFSNAQLTGADPSTAATAVLGEVLPKWFNPDTTSNLQSTQIEEMQVGGTVVSAAKVQTKVTVTTQRGAIDIMGMMLAMIRQDGTVLIIDGQHVPAETIQDESAGPRIIDLLNGNIDMFNGTTQVNQ